MKTDSAALAIVIRTADYRENDRILTLFARDYGRVDALSRGCRKLMGKLHAVSEPFCCGEYLFTESRGKLYVSSCKPLHSFFHIHDDITAFAVGSVMLEACGSVVTASGDPKLFALITNALFALDAEPSRADELFCFFVLKLYAVLGFRPERTFDGEADALAQSVYKMPPKAILSEKIAFPAQYTSYCAEILGGLVECRLKSLSVYEELLRLSF